MACNELPEKTTAMFRTRRDFLTASSGVMALFPALGHAGEAWANMIPAEWTPEDIHAILNQSPWSREVDLELDPAWAPRARARAKSTRRDNRLQTEFRVLVRWESGLPVRLRRGAVPVERQQAAAGVHRAIRRQRTGSPQPGRRPHHSRDGRSHRTVHLAPDQQQGAHQSRPCRMDES